MLYTKGMGAVRQQFKRGGSPAWTRKEGKSESGGLNEKGRKSYEKANPGSNLKAPQPEGGSRKKMKRIGYLSESGNNITQ